MLPEELEEPVLTDHFYFGVPRPEPGANWRKTMDQIAALKPSVGVPGHEGPGATRRQVAGVTGDISRHPETADGWRHDRDRKSVV